MTAVHLRWAERSALRPEVAVAIQDSASELVALLQDRGTSHIQTAIARATLQQHLHLIDALGWSDGPPPRATERNPYPDDEPVVIGDDGDLLTCRRIIADRVRDVSTEKGSIYNATWFTLADLFDIDLFEALT